MADWNPRYIAYCQAHGHTPEQQKDHDEQAYPGGRMCGFILWIGEAWHRWAQEAGEKRSGYDGQGAWSDRQHAAFDAWLNAGGMNP